MKTTSLVILGLFLVPLALAVTSSSTAPGQVTAGEEFTATYFQDSEINGDQQGSVHLEAFGPEYLDFGSQGYDYGGFLQSETTTLEWTPTLTRSGTYTLRFTDTNGHHEENVVLVDPSTLASITISAADGTMGDTIPLTLTAVDEFNNLRSAEITLSGATTGTHQVPGTFAVQWTPEAPGTHAITATSGEFTATATIEIGARIPGAPMITQVTNETMSWAEPSSDAAILEYRVHQDDGTIHSTTGTTFTFTEPGTYYVTAVNSAGEGPASQSVVHEPPAASSSSQSSSSSSSSTNSTQNGTPDLQTGGNSDDGINWHLALAICITVCIALLLVWLPNRITIGVMLALVTIASGTTYIFVNVL